MMVDNSKSARKGSTTGSSSFSNEKLFDNGEDKNNKRYNMTISNKNCKSQNTNTDKYCSSPSFSSTANAASLNQKRGDDTQTKSKNTESNITRIFINSFEALSTRSLKAHYAQTATAAVVKYCL
jgi:hypothetical protein